MSEMVHQIGKLKKYELKESESLFDGVVRYCKESGIILQGYLGDSDDVEEIANSLLGVVIYNNDIYICTELSDYEDSDDIFRASTNKDGTIDYEVKYYNGGCSFNEAIEYAMKNIKETK